MGETLWAVVVGGLIATIPTVVVAIMQNRAEGRRHRQRLAFESGHEDYRARHDMLMQRMAQGKGGTLYPPWIAIHYALQLVERMDKNGRITPNDIREIREMQKELYEVLGEKI